MKRFLILVATGLLSFLGFAQEAPSAASVDKACCLPTEMAASFPGGDTALRIYVKNRLELPRQAMQKCPSGSMVVSFTIAQDGRVLAPATVQDLGYGSAEALLKVVKHMPKWMPAKQNGKYVAVSRQIALTFSALDKTVKPALLAQGAAFNTYKIYKQVAVAPRYPGGQRAMQAFLLQQIRLTPEAIAAKVNGQLLADFVVRADGRLANIKISNDLGFGTDASAISVLKYMPPWIPAQVAGQPVSAYFSIPIRFDAAELNPEPYTPTTGPLRSIEVLAEFPGGRDSLRAYMQKNMVVPQRAIDAGIIGTLVLEFLINRVGEISEITVKRSLGFGIDEAGVAMVQKMPNWKPAQQQGRVEGSYYILSIPINR